MNNKIGNAEMVETIQKFIKQMLIEGYSPFYIGKMCALLIHANDLLGCDESPQAGQVEEL